MLPDCLDNYGIVATTDLIGEGSFYNVYPCQYLSEKCALKVSKRSVKEEECVSKEYNRGQIIWPITRQHPNLNTILWHGLIPLSKGGENHLCTVWEFADSTLQKLPPANEPTLFRYIHEIASALSFLHSQKIVHRDIKPANIFLRRGAMDEYQAILGDLGLARDLHGAKNRSAVGTPLYAHRNQLKGGEVKEEFDTYSLALIFLDHLGVLRSKPPRTEITTENDQQLANWLTNFNFSVNTYRTFTNILSPKNSAAFVSPAQLFEAIRSESSFEWTRHNYQFPVASPLLASVKVELEKRDLDDTKLLSIVSTSVGDEETPMADILRQNLLLLGAFRVKQLAWELITSTAQAISAAESILSAIKTYDPTDDEKVLKKSLAQIRAVNCQLIDRSNAEGCLISAFKSLVDATQEFIDRALLGFYNVEQGRPHDYSPSENGVPAATLSTYLDRLPSYKSITQQLLQQLKSQISESRRYYSELCDLLEGQTSGSPIATA